MDVAVDRAENNGAPDLCRRRVVLGPQDRERAFEDLRGHDELGEEELACLELVADDPHGFLQFGYHFGRRSAGVLCRLHGGGHLGLLHADEHLGQLTCHRAPFPDPLLSAGVRGRPTRPAALCSECVLGGTIGHR